MKHAAWGLFFLYLDNDQGLQMIHCFTWRYLQVNFFISKKETNPKKSCSVCTKNYLMHYIKSYGNHNHPLIY